VVTSAISVRTITPAEHLAYLRSLPSASFLQTPAWGKVKSEWRADSIGFFATDRLIGVGLVLYRQLPKIKRYLAYVPEGPVLDWSSDAVPDLLSAMADHLRRQHAFGIRIGPPVVARRWSAAAVKEAIADPSNARLGDMPPTSTDSSAQALRQQLESAGWIPQATDEGFAIGQPQYVFQVPLAERTEADLLAGMNQLWRRNIKKADKAGVKVTTGARDDLAAFHALYVETAERDHFRPRPLSYFEVMWDALSSEAAADGDQEERIRLYLAHHEGDLLAATIWIRVGTHAWYSYGASSTHKREVRGSNAVQWQMMRDALAAGATVYDLRGITDTLDADDPHIGLIQFKVGTGGEAVEYLGEWDLPLNRLVYKAFDIYMGRR
jgi:lipid II:glycine glycyltransferase (peptidoglycan interpeptide bridge formation enzyme)